MVAINHVVLNMRYGVIGTGAIGGYYGAKLARAGQAFICSAKTKPGLVSHQCYGSINLANFSCRDETLMQAVVNEFRGAGIETGLMEYHEARWKKAVWNMPFNGMTVALHTQTDMLLKNKSTRQLIREQMMEVVTAAQHLGVKNLDASFVDKIIESGITVNN